MFSKKDTGPICPLLKSECIAAKCMWWTHIQGKHPQNGSDLNMHDCSIKWLPVLLIENSKETRQAAAAVETMRNESVTASQHVAGAIMALATSNQLLENKQ